MTWLRSTKRTCAGVNARLLPWAGGRWALSSLLHLEGVGCGKIRRWRPQSKESRMSRRARSLFVAAMTLASLAPIMGNAPAGLADSTPAAAPQCIESPPPPLPPAGQFVDEVDNTYFPLEPGTTLRYRGLDSGDRVADTVTVTDQAKTILGIHATVVFDGVVTNGRPSERTFDWYAQDRHGNVWYLGENAFEFVGGHWEKSADSWEAGVNGALAGIIMEAHSK